MNDYRVVMGCVNTMIDSGLVKEVSKGLFRREEIREKSDTKEFKVIKQTKETPMVKQTTQEVSPIELLGAFASKLRELANEAENIAIAVAGQAEKNDAETAKMRQLQALLKSLG